MTTETLLRPKTSEEMAEIFEDIRQALRGLPKNANIHDRARLSIGICIENGIVTTGAIIGVLMKLDFSNRHAAAILTGSTGTDPVRHFWTRDENGQYRNLDKPSLLPEVS